MLYIKSKKQTIGNYALIASLFFIMMSEWNFYEWYLKFSQYNIYTMALGIGIALVCYIRTDYLKDVLFWICSAVNVFTIFCIIVSDVHIKCLALVFCISFGSYLCQKITFSKSQLIFSGVLISAFFFYWTIDVKGYFKGYDTAYGSLILLCGFMFAIVLIEYFRFYIKIKCQSENKLLNFFINHTEIIAYAEILIILIGINIMKWYQSDHAVIGLATFCVLILIPNKIIGNKLFFIPISLIICAYTTIFDIWPYFVLWGGMPRLAAVVLCAGLFISLIWTQLYVGFHIKNNYFCKLSFAATLAIIAISYVELFIVLQPFILIYLCFAVFGSSLKLDENARSFSPFDIKKYVLYLKKCYINNTLASSAVILLVIVPIFVRIPLEVFYSNQKDVLFSVDDFIFILLICGLVFWILLSFVTGLFTEYTHKHAIVAIFSFGIMIYIQDMFLNVKLSEPDGSRLDISKMGTYPLINAVVWGVAMLLMIVLLLLFYNKCKKLVFIVSLCLALVQLIAAVSLPLTIQTINHKTTYGLSDYNEFVLAKEQNTVVFILDRLGNKQMDLAVKEYPHMLDNFSDFTYFTNADSVYEPTYPSITHMFTGEYLDFSFADAYDWLKYAWTNDKIEKYYKVLHDNNIEVDLYSKDVEYEMGNGENIYGKFDNIMTYQHFADKKAVARQMAYMSLFRILPYPLKHKFNIVADDLEDTVALIGDAEKFEYYTWLFWDKLQASNFMKDESIENALKIYHLSGSHPPRYLDGNLIMQDDNVSIEESVFSSMELVNIYISHMKELGLYDNSTIIITADHGTMEEVIDPQPIFLIKKSGETHDIIKYTNAPVSHDNLIATIYDSFNLDYSDYGKTVFDYKENEKRERTLWYTSDDKNLFFLYGYTGDCNDLLEKFPSNPDDIVKNPLRREKKRNK